MELNKELETAIRAAKEAGKVIMPLFGKPVGISYKKDKTMVTREDKKADSIIRSILWESFPDYGLISEESERGESEYTWVIDPLDGTSNFARGIPLFVVSIGLRMKGEGLVGVCYDPVNDKIYYAEKGQGAYLNAEPIHVSENGLEGGIIGFGYNHQLGVRDRILTDFGELDTKFRIRPRISGSSALSLCNVAAGRAEAFIEYGLSLWDIAAAELIIRKAGGRVNITNYDNYECDIIASNSLIHDQLLQMLNEGKE